MKNRAVRISALVMAICLLIGVAFYFVAGNSLHFTAGSSDPVSSSESVELLAGDEVKQSFTCDYDELREITLSFGTFGKEIADTFQVKLLLEGEELPLQNQKISFNHSTAEYTKTLTLIPKEPISDAKGKTFTVTVESLNGVSGNAASLHLGNSIESLRGSVELEITEGNALLLNGVAQTGGNGKLAMACLTVHGRDYHWFGSMYWYFYALASLVVALIIARVLYCYKKEKKNAILGVIQSIQKYNFLIRQLVARDFKTKYKRSVLGVLWSFLNPLLTMGIQYVVFSTLFGANIPHFPIYLLSGIVCFNFFSETANMCLMSIVGNATLINKVYVPKYIYPFSRTLSTGINLLLSLVPLTLMLFIEGTPLSVSLLLLPFVFLMLFMFSYGMGLILATLMVFFRDTQFLWGIFSMLLMYLTPIFYSEAIIPEWFLPIYKLNPMYHVLRFIRSILIDGVSPEPKAYLFCILLCAVPLLLGVLIFRKKQNQFIFNI